MSSVKIEGNASGTGIFTLASPNSNTNRTLTLPDNTGTIVTTGSSTAITQSMIGTGVAGTGPAFRAYRTANQTVTNVTDTKVQLNAENFDTANCFDSTTNYRFTPNVAGYYQFNAMIGGSGSTSLTYNYIQIWKNGVSDSIAIYAPYANTTNYGQLSTLIYMNGTTDYVELYVQLNGTGTMNVTGGSGAVSTYMSGFLARAA